MPDQSLAPADRIPVAIPRYDAINAAGACCIAANHYRRQAKLRSNSGPTNASHRAWLRLMADEAEQAGRVLQAAADAAVR
jgi:hypothetical protein